MSEPPLISIVVPTLNQARFIEQTLASIIGQNWPRTELIVIDGGSTDGTREIVQRFPVAHFVSEPDRGQADAINKGMQLARGDILAWLNSDDVYFPHTVSEAVEILRTRPEVGMVYGDADLIDDSGAPAGKFASKQTSYRQMLRGSVHIPQATTFFRTDAWNQIGPLDLSLFFSFDYDLWVRIAKVSQVLALFNGIQGGVSGQ